MRSISGALRLAALVLIMGIMLLPVACGPLKAAPEPAPETAPTPPLAPPLELAVMGPRDGTATPRDEESVEFTVGTWGIPVVGTTRVDAAVTVGGTLVDVNEDGMFVHPVSLAEGQNLIEVTAGDLLGNKRTISMVVHRVSPRDIPLYVFWPADNSTDRSASVPVIGTTSVDAVVTVNGIPVEVDDLGIFSISVALEEGPNIIEVMASDLWGNVQSLMVVVFHIP